MTFLAVTIGGLGWRAEVERRLAATLSVNAQLSAVSASSEALFVSDKQFDALLEGLRAGRRIKEIETLIPLCTGETRYPLPSDRSSFTSTLRHF
jgi:hypothetical protein